MFSFTVSGKEYKVRFGYGVLCKTNLIDRVVNLSNQKDEEHAFQNMMTTVAELLLSGLQKKHRDEFGYETDSEKKAVLEKIYDLMDDYEDESTEENPQDGYTLFEMLQKELMANGFLSKITNKAEEVAEKQNATKIPQDHKKKTA